MKASEVARASAFIVGAWPNAKLSPEALAALFDTIGSLPYDEVVAALRRLSVTTTFTPSIREIREAVFVARLGLPSVAAAVHEVAVARGTRRVEDAAFTHPLIREAVLEVGASRIHEEWRFAHREIEATYERLRRELLDAVNVGDLEGTQPRLPGRLPTIACGLDPFEKPQPPMLGDGESFAGWSLDEGLGRWVGAVLGGTETPGAGTGRGVSSIRLVVHKPLHQRAPQSLCAAARGRTFGRLESRLADLLPALRLDSAARTPSNVHGAAVTTIPAGTSAITPTNGQKGP